MANGNGGGFMPQSAAAGFSAANDLGLGMYGADALRAQVGVETEEQRRRRLAGLQQRSLLGPQAETSPAQQMLFGRAYSGTGGFGRAFG